MAGTDVRPGDRPLVVRVGSRTELNRKTLPVRIEAVESDGTPLRFESAGDTPALVNIAPPPSWPVSLLIAAPHVARLVLDPAQQASTTPTALQAGRPPTRLGAYHLDLIPEAGDLVAGLDNRLFVRLLDVDQRPIANAPLAILHPRLPNQRVALTTDAQGLAELQVKADRPTLEVRVELTSSGSTVTHPLQLVAVGRELTLSTEPHVVGGATTRAKIQTLRLRGSLWCELLDGETWAWAKNLPLDGRPELAFEVPIPPAPTGHRFDLQCSLSATSPGLAWASRPLIVGATDTRTTTALEAAFTATRTTRPWQPPRLVLSTRETDLAAAIANWEGARHLMLVALVSVVATLFLTGALVLILHIRRTKRRIADALAGEPVDAAALRTITRTRGVFVIAMATALAIGWVAAVGALLS
jgi:hypothetical protein